jgi:hypothetical protein
MEMKNFSWLDLLELRVTFGALVKPRKEVETFKLFCCLTQSSIIISIAICCDFDGARERAKQQPPFIKQITQYSPFLIHWLDPRTVNKLMKIGDHFSFSAWIAPAWHSVPLNSIKENDQLTQKLLTLMIKKVLIKGRQFAN